ncbi:hypothetical protein BDF19DRAFT_468117 [Syncephalis fuscata]|nr:hypothetical protein BDF19DRAFT_468117 [Syncephalis fuscata]
MEDAYRQTVNAATASLDWEAKERMVVELTESQRRLKETLDKMTEAREQYRVLQEENAMLRIYCNNLNNTANRKEEAQQ